MAMSIDQLVKLYVDNIVKLLCTAMSIVSDRDARFTIRVWEKFKKLWEWNSSLVQVSNHRQMVNH